MDQSLVGGNPMKQVATAAPLSTVASRMPDRVKHALRSAVLRANGWAGRYRDVVWIVGDGRSGTTWLGEVLNAHQSYRSMFEPLHPLNTPLISNASCFRYARPGDADAELHGLLESVFSGSFLHPRVDFENRRLTYSGLLVKDIYGHLFFKWASVNFPHVKRIILLRHPFAVALSKQKLRHWGWMEDPTRFFDQPHLLEDHLHPFESLIRTTEGYFEKAVMVWAVIHHVLFKQISGEDAIVVCYEDLCSNPEPELRRLLQHTGKGSSVGPVDPALLARIQVPSRVSKKHSAVLTKTTNLVNTWSSELSAAQVATGYAILDAFGLGGIYGTGTMPNPDAIRSLLGKPVPTS